MVAFSCEACGDVLTKKKLEKHRDECYGASFTCLDCMVHFEGSTYRTHTSCITEDQKYRGPLYKERKPQHNKRVSQTRTEDASGLRQEADTSRDDDVAMVDAPERASNYPQTEPVNVFDFLLPDPIEHAPRPGLGSSYDALPHDFTPWHASQSPGQPGEELMTRTQSTQGKAKDKRTASPEIEVKKRKRPNPPHLHSGLTGGLNRLSRGPDLPPSPSSDYDVNDIIHRSPLRHNEKRRRLEPSPEPRPLASGSGVKRRIKKSNKEKTRSRELDLELDRTIPSQGIARNLKDIEHENEPESSEMSYMLKSPSMARQFDDPADWWNSLEQNSQKFSSSEDRPLNDDSSEDESRLSSPQPDSTADESKAMLPHEEVYQSLKPLDRKVQDIGNSMSPAARSGSLKEKVSLIPNSMNDEDLRTAAQRRMTILRSKYGASHLSRYENLLRRNVVCALTQSFLPADESVPFYRITIDMINEKWFVNNFRRGFSLYCFQLQREARNEREELIAKVLQNGDNDSLMRSIMRQVRVTEKDEKEPRSNSAQDPCIYQKDEDGHVARVSPSGEPITHHDVSWPQYEESSYDFASFGAGGDLSDKDISKNGLSVLDTEEIKRFLQSGAAFRALIMSLQLLLLPDALRTLVNEVPKALISTSAVNNPSVTNRLKLFLENYTGYCWDWWPLSPPVPNVRPGSKRVEWKWYGRTLYTVISHEDACRLEEILKLAEDHPPKCLCCVTKPSSATLSQLFHYAATRWRLSLTNIPHFFRNATNTDSRAAQRYTPSPPLAADASGNEASLTSGTTSLNVPAMSREDTDSSRVNVGIPSTQSAGVENLRVLFAVQGWRWSLELERIFIPNRPCDSSFFRMLRAFHRVHRHALIEMLSPFRFLNCRFVKLERMYLNRVMSSWKQELPDYHGHAHKYDYEPRPPKVSPPLIDPRILQILLSECNELCPWSILPWHDCIRLSPLSSYVAKIPKKKDVFQILSQSGDEIAFGIEADYMLSFRLLAIYHLIAIIPCFGFWAYWMAKNSGDWQNASVPLMTVASLVTVFWIMAGKRVGVS